MGEGDGRGPRPQMGRPNLLEIGVGVKPAGQAQIGELGQQVAGRGAGILHPIDINELRPGQDPGGPLQFPGGHRFQGLLQLRPVGAHRLEGEVPHPLPGPQGKAPQVVQGVPPDLALLLAEGPFELPVPPVAQPPDAADHRGLADPGAPGQFPDGKVLQLLGVRQEKLRHLLL